MARFKKIFILFWIVFFFLTLNVLGTNEELITFQGISTTMPEVVSEEDYQEEILLEEDDDSFFIQRGSTKIDPTVGAKPDESISQLIARFATDTTVVGIDVSSHQAEIDWKAVADSGVKFAMLRCGFRGYGDTGTLVKDTYFDRNIENALANGIYVGVYFYSTALNEEEALQEAVLTYECIQNYKLKYPVCYDFEEFGIHRTANLSNEQMHKNAKLFLDYIKEKGYTVSLYGSAFPLRDTWKMGQMKDYDTWVAHYYVDKTSYEGSYQLWQYTDNATVPGISTRVDVDVDYAYWAGMKAANSLNPYIKNTGWNKIDSHWCYLTNDGILAIGWKYINGKWYYFNPNDGIMLEEGVSKIFDDYYFFNSSGAMIGGTRWYKDSDGKWYYISETGAAQKGWLKYKNVWYYLDPETAQMVTNSMIYSDGLVYWFDNNGVWTNLEDGWHLIEDGNQRNWYYFKKGCGLNNWQLIDNIWYYFDKGIMVKGWRKINNVWYFFNWSGEMCSNTVLTIDGKTYGFDENGAMISNLWVKTNDNNWYYFGESGAQEKKTGWQYIDGVWYYIEEDGTTAIHWKKIKGIWYYFDLEGKMLSKTFIVINGQPYYFESSGAIRENSWLYYESNWYYFKKEGAAARGGWMYINKKWYYFDDECKMFHGEELELGNKIYTFDSSGAWIGERYKEMNLGDLVN
ncbi:MAG: hypothetical protein IJ629_01730 [Clostridia bacterium]|nr:hypothetical protein [Clostridia bacterium]